MTQFERLAAKGRIYELMFWAETDNAGYETTSIEELTEEEAWTLLRCTEIQEKLRQINLYQYSEDDKELIARKDEYGIATGADL